MRIEELNRFLAGRRILDIGLCYGSTVHIRIDSGAITLGGADWRLIIDGVEVENAEAVSHSRNLQPLVDRVVLGLRILDENRCALRFEGASFLLTNAAHADYEIGAEMFGVFCDSPDGSSAYCDVQAPLAEDDFEWRDAKTGPGWFVPKAQRRKS